MSRSPFSFEGSDGRESCARLRAVADFAEVFVRPGFVAGEWSTEPGVMPWFSPAAEVSAFEAAAYRAGLVFPFDWAGWADEGARLLESPAALEAIDLETVPKLVTMMIRQNRFVEGSLGAHVENGAVTAVLRRLAVLAAAAFTRANPR